MRDEVVGKLILTWVLHIFKLLKCIHAAVARSLGHSPTTEDEIVHVIV